MSAFSSLFGRPRNAALRLPLCASVLAAGLWAWAGADDVSTIAVPGPAPSRAAASRPLSTTADVDPTGAAAPPPGAAPASQRAYDAPPYAPGGDDLMHWEAPELKASRWLAVAPAFEGRPPPPQAAPPSVMLWLDRKPATAADSVVLHLATIGAADCRGRGALPGLQAVGGRFVLRPTTPGRHRLAVDCSGPGGRIERTLTLAVPLPAQASSRANRLQAAADLPAAEGTPTLSAPGDFFQEGRVALFVVSADGAAGFLARDDHERWVDRGAELLPEAQDLAACGAPVQALTSDFNGDGRPDVYLACDGGPQLLWLSQPDGRYRRVETAFPLHAQGAEADDLDGDGHADIVTADGERTLVLRGRGDGSFDIEDAPPPGAPYSRR